MGLLADIFSSIIRKNKNQATDTKENYIFYKIVDLIEHDKFVLQCINTNAIFQANIVDIVFDLDILYGLHPIQACYVGIEYGKYIKKFNDLSEAKRIQNTTLRQYLASRYGNYHLCFQNRQGELSFINVSTNDEYIMDPRDIALTEELISEFDAAQAFYIGVTAGLKINNPIKKRLETGRSHLHIVK